jgi:hypothetical protein
VSGPLQVKMTPHMNHQSHRDTFRPMLKKSTTCTPVQNFTFTMFHWASLLLCAECTVLWNHYDKRVLTFFTASALCTVSSLNRWRSRGLMATCISERSCSWRGSKTKYSYIQCNCNKTLLAHKEFKGAEHAILCSNRVMSTP